MTADLSGFLASIVGEADAIVRFVRLLERENALLAEGRSGELAAAVEEKEQLAARLNEWTQRRGRWLAELGFSPDRAGMEAWAARSPEQREAIAAWRRTLSLAARAKEQNRVNGQLIRLHMQFAGQALDVLLRKESHLDLYGPDGRSTNSSGQKIDAAA
jgi:flagellar biosynthesis/type III secretory pathway chaperone